MQKQVNSLFWRNFTSNLVFVIEKLSKAGTNMKKWDRQKNEPISSFMLFAEFRDSGRGRKLDSIARKNQIPPVRIKHLSVKWDWKKRSLEFDRFINKNLSPLINKAALSQTLEKLIAVINEKSSSNDDIGKELDLDKLVRTLGTYSKAVPDILKTMELLATGSGEGSKTEKYRLLSAAIRNDEKAFKMASRLLSRVSEINK